jgi:hypothetical protein
MAIDMAVVGVIKVACLGVFSPAVASTVAWVGCCEMARHLLWAFDEMLRETYLVPGDALSIYYFRFLIDA